MTENPHLMAAGVWSIFITRQDGKRLLDGETVDSAEARRLFHNAIRDEPETTLVELVNSRGRVVDQSKGAYLGPHSSLTH